MLLRQRGNLEVARSNDEAPVARMARKSQSLSGVSSPRATDPTSAMEVALLAPGLVLWYRLRDFVPD